MSLNEYAAPSCFPTAVRAGSLGLESFHGNGLTEAALSLDQPPSSPDLTPLEFFWGVYKGCSLPCCSLTTLPELAGRIWDAATTVTTAPPPPKKNIQMCGLNLNTHSLRVGLLALPICKLVREDHKNLITLLTNICLVFIPVFLTKWATIHSNRSSAHPAAENSFTNPQATRRVPSKSVVWGNNCGLFRELYETREYVCKIHSFGMLKQAVHGAKTMYRRQW